MATQKNQNDIRVQNALEFLAGCKPSQFQKSHNRLSIMLLADAAAGGSYVEGVEVYIGILQLLEALDQAPAAPKD